MERYNAFRGIPDIYSLHFLVKIALSLSIIRKHPRKPLENYFTYLLTTLILRTSKWQYFTPGILDTHSEISSSLNTIPEPNFDINFTRFLNLLRSIDDFNYSFNKRHCESSFMESINLKIYSLKGNNKRLNSNLDFLLNSFHELLYLKKDPMTNYLLFGENIVELFSNIGYLPHPQNTMYLRRFVRDLFCLFSFEDTNLLLYVFSLFKKLARTGDISSILFYEYSFCSLSNLSLLNSEKFYCTSSQLYYFFLTSNLIELCEHCFPLNKLYNEEIQKLMKFITIYYNDYIISTNPNLFSLYKIKITSLASNICLNC